MSKEEELIGIMSEVSENYKNNFYSSVDAAFNNCIFACTNEITQKYQNDPEIMMKFNSLITYMRYDISNYAISAFSSKNLGLLLSKIKKDSEKAFDDYFINNIEERKKNNIWINAVEERLYELLKK